MQKAAAQLGPSCSLGTVLGICAFGNSVDGCNAQSRGEGLFCCLVLMALTVFRTAWWLRLLGVCPQCRRPRFHPWVGKIPWRRESQPTPVLLPRIPWMEEPGDLQFMGSQRVGYDWVTSLSLKFLCIHWSKTQFRSGWSFDNLAISWKCPYDSSST